MDNYVGKRLDGRYEIREVIGVGGMAVVYKAYDNIDDRIVAVKILKEEFLANEEFRRRFKNESKAIAVLSHSNIVKVYDVSFGDRLQYIVMEYIEGITLKEYIDQQKVIPWKEALHFVIQILRALQHAHDKGIVHRDVKPQNIMLLQNGTIKVADFGIARFSRGETRTLSESAIGSVHYISPEQARGELTDDKADIYSVGVVLYEMLTGALPFQADSAVSVAIMQLQNEAVRPRDINSDIPVGLEQITMKAMQKNTRDRYQSAAEMLLDLEEFKRNPMIKFDYTYFVDNMPTKHIVTPTVSPAAVSVEPAKEEKPTFSDETTVSAKNRVIPVLAGVIASLVLVVVIFLIVQIASRGGIGSLFLNKKIEVESFVGKNYLNEIKDNSEYAEKYNFEIIYQSNSAYEAGTVFEQDPKAGQEINLGATVKLSVVNESTLRQVPQILGLSVAEGEYALVSGQGFVMTKVPVEDPSATLGTIVKVLPEEGSWQEMGSVITVYVASEFESDTVVLPKLTEGTIETAKDIIEACGLRVGLISDENSTTTKGIVVSQEPAEGTEVEKDSVVNLWVSTGIPAQNDIDLTIKLPSAGDLSLGVFLNDKLIGDKIVVYTEGQDYTVSVTGSGENNVIKIVLGETKIYEAKVDFTKTPPELSSVKTYQYVSKPVYIDVVGNEAMVGKARLEDAGFKNVNIVLRDSDVGEPGVIYSQSPAYSSIVNINANTKITLYVVNDPNAESEPTDIIITSATQPVN